MTTPDNYAAALVRLKQTAIFLYGIGVGYNNHRSDRDAKLAGEIGALLEKHEPRPNEYILLCKMPGAQEWTQVHKPYGSNDPYVTAYAHEAEAFMKRMVDKWPTTKYRVVEIKYEDRT